MNLSSFDMRNMTSLDAEYLAVAVNNLIIASFVDLIIFSVISSPHTISCIPTEGQVEEKDVCYRTASDLLCRLYFDVEMNFTALSLSIMDLDQGINTLLNYTSCLYTPSFGNLSLVELLIDVPAGWNCESHSSWTFPDLNKTSLRPFRVNITRETGQYIISVSKVDDLCLDNVTLMCDKYINVQASEFEFVSNHTKESLRILKGDTVLPPDQFQIQPDGSAVYCLKEYVWAELNLDALGIMSTVGTVLSMLSVLIVTLPNPPQFGWQINSFSLHCSSDNIYITIRGCFEYTKYDPLQGCGSYHALLLVVTFLLDERTGHRSEPDLWFSREVTYSGQI